MQDKLKDIQKINGQKILNTKIKLSVWSFIFAMIFGVAGIIIAPMGIIDSSVLILIAQLLVLTGTLLGGSFTFDFEHKYFHADTDADEDEDKKEEKTVKENEDK